MQKKVIFPLAVLAAAAAFAAAVRAAGPDQPQLSPVPSANPKSVGYGPASRLSGELQQVAVAQGAMRLENPQGIVTHYGYENDTPSAGDPSLPQMVPVGAAQTEAQKTEPDKNTYLVFKHGRQGADPSYDYGTHFLYQGHENGAPVAEGKQGYLTRINLDADTDHRLTLLASHDVTGAPIATIDGSTWDPFAERLILTTESPSAPTYSATADYPSQVKDVSGALGRGGYEGVQDDADGNLWIVEDIGGSTKPGSVNAKLPNSFVYRYVPARKGDLKHGKLEALQVLNAAGAPVTFESQSAINAPDQVALHSYGASFATRWVTVHDTATDGSAPFNANTAAKAKHATPFKRPENGVFRPGSHFGEFFFTETGDTNATSTENATAGGWGGLFKLTQSGPSASTGKISVFFKGSLGVTGLDNLTFLSTGRLAVGEDAGDTLHSQRNGLDSAFVFDVGTDYAAGAAPVRWLAEGRDAPATIDSASGGFGKNDGDNEITGVHVSNGDPGPAGILGAKNPNLGDSKWRWFYTQQHGDNVTYEVLVGSRADHGDNDDD